MPYSHLLKCQNDLPIYYSQMRAWHGESRDRCFGAIAYPISTGCLQQAPLPRGAPGSKDEVTLPHSLQSRRSGKASNFFFPNPSMEELIARQAALWAILRAKTAPALVSNEPTTNCCTRSLIKTRKVAGGSVPVTLIFI